MAIAIAGVVEPPNNLTEVLQCYDLPCSLLGCFDIQKQDIPH